MRTSIMYRAPVIGAMVVGLLGALAAMIWLGAGTAEATFPGDNGRIAFESSRDGDPEIFTMNADGTGVRKLTNNSVRDISPAWSADGKKIAFASNRHNSNFEIFTMNADGTGVRKLANMGSNERDPAFSPDGSKIAFVSDFDVWSDIWVMNSDGSCCWRNLTNDGAFDFYPTFSPDDSKIAFVSTTDDPFDWDIYAINADGSGRVNLTVVPNNSALDIAPSFSPDGSKIAFQSNRDGDPEIYVMNSDGTGVRKLTSNAVHDYEPVFSPDGSKIAFSSERDGDVEIYVMNASDGSEVQKLTNNRAEDAGDYDADWQPNNVRTPIALPTPPLRVPPPAPGLIIRDHVPPDHLTPIKTVGRDQQKDLENATEPFVDGKRRVADRTSGSGE